MTTTTPLDLGLELPADLARAFLGGLLTVCRADGYGVSAPEFETLRRIAAALPGAGSVDDERLLFSHVTPRALAEAADALRAAGPFRSSAIPAPARLARAFIDAALHLGRADGSLNDAELRAIRHFARALGCSAADLGRLESLLDDGHAA